MVEDMKTSCRLTCSLCRLPVSEKGVIDENLPFCCPGCQAVYRILESKGRLQNYQDQPVFQQAIKSGLISNPELLEELKKRSQELDELETERVRLEIGELWCPSCADIIQLVLMHEKGVKRAVVDYTTDLASIEFCPRFLSKDKILSLIKGLGYQPAELSDVQEKKKRSYLTLRLIIAAFCSLNIMMLAFPVYASFFNSDPTRLSALLSWLSLVFSLPVLTYSAWPIYRRFWQGLKLGFLGMESLITLSVFSAFILSCIHLAAGSLHIYFDSMSVVVTFLLLGKVIESRAKFSAKESLLHLTRALPRRGRQRIADGTLTYTLLKEVNVGDILVAHAGEKIVLDGVIAEGEGAADESLITGESVPVLKKAGDMVAAGSVLQSGSLSYRVSATLEGSTLQSLISMIEQDLSHKVKYERVADRVVQWFVPLVVILAAAAYLISGFTSALSVLLIACPCSLGIAVPLVESRMLHRLAGMGALVRNRGCLALLGKETLYVFDKTGTVTEGKFTVLRGLEKLSNKERSILKAMTQKSAHPIASSIDQALQAAPSPLDSFCNFHGKGLQAGVGKDDFMLGSRLWTKPKDPAPRQSLFTSVYFVKNGHLLSKIELGDRIRPEIKEVAAALPQSICVSGDAKATVSAVAGECLFSDFRAETSPLEKGEFVSEQRERGEIVCFIGDGVNDAPAIARAQVGISVKAAADMSIQASDVLLTTEDLKILPRMRAVGNLGRKRIGQNLFWAFGYNVVGIGLAMGGVLSPIYAAAAMVASSLIVIVNAQRI